MSVNGTVRKTEYYECSQCHDPVYKCDNCDEYFSPDEFLSCGDDDKHICEQCYEDFGPKALNETINGVSLEEFRMHVLNVLKKRFPHVGEKSYENIKDAQDEILVKLQPTAPRGGGEEICICSAVKTEDGDIIKGHRHHDCFRAIESRNKKILKEQGAQGFITSHGRYVDRKEGCSLMRLAGRKSRAGFEFKEDDILTSEDLY